MSAQEGQDVPDISKLALADQQPREDAEQAEHTQDVSTSQGDAPDGEDETESQPGRTVIRYSPAQVLAELQALPDETSTHSCRCMRGALESQHAVLQMYKAFVAAEAGPTLEDVDLTLLLFLRNIYLLVSAMPAALSFDALEDLLARSGLVAPFVDGVLPNGAFAFGLPSNDAIADDYKELIRLAAATVVSYYAYANFPTVPGTVPADNAVLLFSTVAIRSLAHKPVVDKLTQQLNAIKLPRLPAAPAAAGESSDVAPAGSEAEPAAGSEPVISLAQVRWLLHFFRGSLSGLFGAVSHAVNDTQRHKESLIAQQADYLALIKAEPSNAAGYGHYVRTCLQFQQMNAANVFAAKGAMVAAAAKAPLYEAQLAVMRGVALALGGAGDHVRAGELRELLASARAKLDVERAALPSVYRHMLELEPEMSVLAEHIVPRLGDAADRDEVPVLDFMFSTRPPGLPRGALTVRPKPQQEGAGEGAGSEGGAEAAGSAGQGRGQRTAGAKQGGGKKKAAKGK